MKWGGRRDDVAEVIGEDPGLAAAAINCGLAVEGELRRRPGIVRQPGVFTRVGGPSRAIAMPTFDNDTYIWWWGSGTPGDFEPPAVVWPGGNLLAEPGLETYPETPWTYVKDGRRIPITRSGKKRKRPGNALVCTVSLPLVVHNGNKTATITFTHADGTPAFEAIGATCIILWSLAPLTGIASADIAKLTATSVGVSWPYPGTFTAMDRGKKLSIDAAAIDPVAKRALSPYANDMADVAYYAVAQPAFMVADLLGATAATDTGGGGYDWTTSYNMSAAPVDDYWRGAVNGSCYIGQNIVAGPLDMNVMEYAGFRMFMKLGRYWVFGSTGPAGLSVLEPRYYFTGAKPVAEYPLGAFSLVKINGGTESVVWSARWTEGDEYTIIIIGERVGRVMRRRIYVNGDLVSDDTGIIVPTSVASLVMSVHTGYWATFSTTTGIRYVSNY